MGAQAGVGIETNECPVAGCGFSSKRLTAFEAHLVEVHGVTSQALWDQLHGGPTRCACGCGQGTRWLGWKQGYARMLRGHNGSLVAVYGQDRAAEITEQRARKLRGKTGWSKGLTKEDDARVALRAKATALGRKKAFAQGRVTVWSKGLTKETDARVAKFAHDMRAAYAAGTRVSWSQGLTKKTDARIAAMAAQNSITHSLKEIRAHLDGQKRRSIDEVRALIEATGELTVVDGLESYTNECKSQVEVECRKCGSRARTIARYLYGGRCRACHPQGSMQQLELFAFVSSLVDDTRPCDRSVVPPLELDVWVPSRMFALEYDGLYWHSEINKSSAYHAQKTARCAALGIRLMHVFEDDWRDRRPIVESLIRHRLGLTPRKVSARECELRALSTKERRAFFEANHLDGDVAAHECLGLVFRGEVVMALSLRKPFHRAHSDRLEVARSCPALDTVVRGGLSRLIKAALARAKEQGRAGLITYVDGRIGDGAGYIKAGLRKTGETPPRFWWTDFDRRFNRFKFKANAAEGLSEREVAAQAGVVKVWGCSNVVLTIDA
jgi:hypothetical protein